MIRFDYPWAFFLLAVVAFIGGYKFFFEKRAGIRFSSTANAVRVRKSLKQRLLFIPLTLRILALVLIVLALARPQMGKEKVRDISRGIAIEMVVDRSSSMQLKKNLNGKWMNRLDIVKDVFSKFVNGDGGKLAGRPNDLIGMVAFARYPDTLCPLTLSHGALNRFIDSLKLVTLESEDGTSIGDAIALAAARLSKAEESLAKSNTALEGDEAVEGNVYEIKSKVMILLSDGEDTGSGEYSPLKAAELAKEWGVKIYTILIGGKGWFAEVNDPFRGRSLQNFDRYVDTRELEKVAELTGGLFRQADDLKSLVDVYDEIDKLEKSEITSERYLDYKELFIPFGIAALILLAFEMILSSTIFRRIP